VELKYYLIYTESLFSYCSLRRTRRLVCEVLWIILHSLDSLVHLFKCVIMLCFEFAHRTVIGVHWDLFFVAELEKGGLLVHNLYLSQLPNVP
jgi:hypothetical protein